ncbi:MAG TPA: hypothetical protein VMN78_00040 [Longimicrobiales bacterium]|nr:hypothetical protein [Longimicrobiales bacterium]
MDLKSIARGVLAVLAGFLTMAVLVLVLSWLAALVTGVDDGPPTTVYLILNVLAAVMAALAGGWVTALVAPRAEWPVWALVTMVVVLGIPGVVGGPAPGQPIWYPISIVLIGGIGAALGGLLQSRGPGEPLAEGGRTTDGARASEEGR